MTTNVDLQRQLITQDETITNLRKEIVKLQKANDAKDQQIKDLTSQLDKYQSVFSPPKRRVRGLGISAEPNQGKNTSQYIKEINFTPFEKDQPTKDLIRKAILENDFMKNLDTLQINEIIDYTQPEQFAEGDVIIQEGDYGNKVFVMEDGTVSVSRGGLRKHDLSGSFVFGELAILYNCTRTATVTALTSCKLWAIDRQCFQSIMMRASILKHQEHLNFLRSVPTFQDLHEGTLDEIATALDEVHFTTGEYIIRQGTPGDKFYIIIKGQVKVTKHTVHDASSPKTSPPPTRLNSSDSSKSPHDAMVGEEQFLRFMGNGEWFGEKALKNDEVRTASILAISEEGVDCLVLDRESYKQLIGELNTFEREYPDEAIQIRRMEQFTDLTVNDLCVIATLGVGGFGRVELVRIGSDCNKTYALKQMKKHHIVETRQQEHVINEKNILLGTDCDFIVKLYRTFKDPKYLYMMMEACLGGEMWSILRDRGSFDDHVVRFYMACVLEALTYLHTRFIIYRDLKPENLLLDEEGYCKITDFGFAKNIFIGRKTWTFCGTPEYVAPEIILNKGHDISADYWSLGILMFELLTGSPPFTGRDPMMTYNFILKGVEQVDFPRKVTKAAQHLITSLCKDNPSERLGCGRSGIQEVHKHPWFAGLDFEALKHRALTPPIIPEVNSATDVSNFDDYPPDSETPPDDITGWDHDF